MVNDGLDYHTVFACWISALIRGIHMRNNEVVLANLKSGGGESIYFEIWGGGPDSSAYVIISYQNMWP